MPDGMPGGSSFARGALLTLPNAITFARLCAVPLAVWLVLRGSLVGAFALFVAAAISDAIDGWLARRAGSFSALGAVLDPVADKALLVTMYVTLAAVDILPDWLAILVVFRDVLIVGGILVLGQLGHRVALRPLRLSKANTAMQLVLVSVALALAAFGLAAPILLAVLIWTTAATTLASGAGYVARVLRAT